MVPLVSLIMTVYNRERYLPQAIESVLTQSYPDFELVIWDDGSNDDSVAIACHYESQDKRIKVVSAPHRGRSMALKMATERASAEYMGWIDSDDLLAATALEETVNILDNSSAVGVVYTDHLVIDEHSAVKEYGKRSLIPYSRDKILTNFMTFHFRLIRRSIYDEVGGVNTSYSCNIDQELCLRLSEVTEFFHINKPLYYYRAHPNSISHLQRIDQIHCAKRAIDEALVRRKLEDKKTVVMRITANSLLTQKSNGSQTSGAKKHISFEKNSWSMSSGSINWLSSFLEQHQINSVVECGSGLSTLLFARQNLQNFLSLEHDKHWLEITRSRLESEKLKEKANLQLCPLSPVSLNGFLLNWYDISQLTVFKADLILIDGPPVNDEILSRYPAPFLLRSYMKQGTWLILDDSKRFYEKEIVKLWLRDIPELRCIERLSIGKGLAVLKYGED